MNVLSPNARILITRTDALGDLILTTPVYRALKQELPNCHLVVLCREYAQPILIGNQNIDEIITISEETTEESQRVTESLKRANFDAALALFPSKFSASLLRDAKIPIRIGSARRFHSWKFTNRINQSRKLNQKSEAQYNLDLLKALNITSSDTTPEVYVQSDELKCALEKLQALAINQEFVVLHPGSAGSAIDWPLDKFISLALELQQRGIKSIFTGNQAERGEIAKNLTRRLTEQLSIAGETTLRELAAVLKLASVVVANSTGPLHLAAAVGTATVGLFPQSASMSPKRWAPPVSNTLVLQPSQETDTLAIPVAEVAEAIMASNKCLK